MKEEEKCSLILLAPNIRKKEKFITAMSILHGFVKYFLLANL